MAIETVKEFFRQYQKETDILEFSSSSATVELAAEAVGVIPARIAKTLSFKQGDSCILIVTAGDTKIDNRKFKDTFSMKAKMLTPDEVLTLTGHAIGGVCPFALVDSNIKVYTDVSMHRFDTLFPACGSSNSAIKLTCEELFTYSSSEKWVDVCSIKE